MRFDSRISGAESSINLTDTRSDHHFEVKTLNILDNLAGKDAERCSVSSATSASQMMAAKRRESSKHAS